MKRVFIAIKIDLSEQVQQVWEQLKRDFRQEKIRWTATENLHLTLRFLGNVDAHQLRQINHVLDGVCRSQKGFSFQLEKLGCFKKHGKPAVVFIDIADSEALVDFVEKLEDSLVEIGFISNSKFTPHLTLGRVKHIRDEQAFYDRLAQFREIPPQRVDVPQIIFYESILKPEGPEYHAIKKFKLE